MNILRKLNTSTASLTAPKDKTDTLPNRRQLLISRPPMDGPQKTCFRVYCH